MIDIAPTGPDAAEARDAGDTRALRDQLRQRTRQLEASEARCHEAIEAHRRQAELLAIVSHDVRSPLSAILGYTDLLQMGVVEGVPPSAQEYVDRIRASAQQVQVILDGMVSG